VGGIVLLLVTATRSDPSAPLQLLSVLLILGGAGLLIARMRERAEPDEDSDDGAVV
jgi:hypothetical protein